MSRRTPPGVDFEEIVAGIQSRIDPNAEVVHNSQIVDRLGHSRQFDVVIRGNFAGQEILGVIECKDLQRKVGTPEIEAFVTKAQDINANFKMVVSRRGFSNPAIEKAKHYGIQTLSLIPDDGANIGFKVGNYWFADVYFWEQLAVTLKFVEEPQAKLIFDAQDLKIGGKKVIDWFTNYLLSNHSQETGIGWIVGVGVEFDRPQIVEIGKGREVECKGIEFHTKHAVAKKHKFVGINGTGFFDWQRSKATMPAQKNIATDAVQTNFMEWEDRDTDEFDVGGFLNVKLIAYNAQFDLVENTIDLERL